MRVRVWVGVFVTVRVGVLVLVRVGVCVDVIVRVGVLVLMPDGGRDVAVSFVIGACEVGTGALVLVAVFALCLGSNKRRISRSISRRSSHCFALILTVADCTGFKGVKVGKGIGAIGVACARAELPG